MKSVLLDRKSIISQYLIKFWHTCLFEESMHDTSIRIVLGWRSPPLWENCDESGKQKNGQFQKISHHMKDPTLLRSETGWSLSWLHLLRIFCFHSTQRYEGEIADVACVLASRIAKPMCIVHPIQLICSHVRSLHGSKLFIAGTNLYLAGPWFCSYSYKLVLIALYKWTK